MADYRLRLVIGTTPSSAIEVSFGAKTPTGLGGWLPTFQAAGPVSVKSQSNAGGSVDVWEINSESRLATKGAYGSAAPTTPGPFSIVLTDGVTDWTVIATMVANEFSIAPRAGDTGSANELRRIYTQTNCTVNFGDVIRARAGVYGDGSTWTLAKQVQFTARSGGPAAPSAPTDPGWVTVTSDANRGAIFRSLDIQGRYLVEHYLKIDGTTLHRLNNGGNAATAALKISATQGLKANRLLVISNNEISSELAPGATQGTSSKIASGINCADTENGNSEIYILDNDFLDLYDGISMTAERCLIRGNEFRRIWNDGRKGMLLDSDIEYNDIVDKYHYTGSHGDYDQSSLPTLTAGTYVGSRWRCNRFVRGAGNDTTDGQGIFQDNQPADVYQSGVVVEGNLINASKNNQITLTRCPGAIVQNNTVTTGAAADAGAGRQIKLTDCVGAIVRRNVAEVITLVGGGTASENVIIALGDGSYEAAFNDPTRDAENNLAVLTQRWGMKPGGSLDMAVTGFSAHVGAAGTGYVDFDARTNNFPP